MLRSIQIPFVKGRYIWTPDIGSALNPSGAMFDTNLQADHFHKGRLVDRRDLGSGLVTNAGVDLLAYDYQWAANAQTLKIENNHGSGTGATAAAVGDITLQTANGTTATAGAQSVTQPNIYKTVATLNYGSSLAITEWGLFMNTTLSGGAGQSGTNTSTTATTLADTGKAWTVNAFAGFVVYCSGTPAFGIVLSNTATVLTIGQWNTPSTNALATTPTSGSATYIITPTMWDHKVFAAINVVNGDSIQFTYSLTCTSGG